VFEVDPLAVTDGQPVGLLWASPDCKHFSKAKGGKPVSKKIRSLAWVVVKWAKLVKPRVICLENVEEFQTWGPLNADNMPCPLRKGRTFKRWVSSLRNLGYVVEWRELRACDYGAPTIRKRLFLVARCDGQPIVWPEATHGAPDNLPVKTKKLKPWRTAAECIDWNITAPSIFERSKPLADATCRRIAKGIMRYVVDAAEPFIVPMTHTGGDRVQASTDPLRTITTAQRGEFGLAVPTLIQTGYGERPGQSPRVPGLDKPIGTLVGGQKHALVSAFLAKHYTGVVGSDMADPMATVTSVDHHSLVTATMVTNTTGHPGAPPSEPMRTITTGGHQALVTANLVGVGARAGQSRPRGIPEPLATITAKADVALVTSHMLKLRGDNVGSAADAPLHTISAQGTHHAEVRAFLIKYYGTDQDPRLLEPMHTVPTKDRFGLVMVKGEPYAIVDIGLRMLAPRELYRAQGFPEDYRIDFGADGRPLTKTAQVRMCGNSVCPPLAKAIVAANYSEIAVVRIAA
jgi:DNA (cytosine-5)-methyltransferase 1